VRLKPAQHRRPRRPWHTDRAPRSAQAELTEPSLACGSH
jgi:hypothetical protein